MGNPYRAEEYKCETCWSKITLPWNTKNIRCPNCGSILNRKNITTQGERHGR
jgi:DNA-directed RNA polymerase subunit RPC12/RpoP